jgi:hypothetical protein
VKKQKKRKEKRWYTLPDGRCTTNVQEMANAWRALGKVFTDITGGRLWAFDPDICIQDSRIGNYDIPARLAVLLAERLPRGEVRIELPPEFRAKKEPLTHTGWLETGLRAIARETKKGAKR